VINCDFDHQRLVDYRKQQYGPPKPEVLESSKFQLQIWALPHCQKELEKGRQVIAIVTDNRK